MRYTHHARLCDLFEAVGFDVRLCEHLDGWGRFQLKDWDAGQGMIRRLRRFDRRNSGGQLGYISIVLDAVKRKG